LLLKRSTGTPDRIEREKLEEEKIRKLKGYDAEEKKRFGRSTNRIALGILSLRMGG
jgi:hypothetical protein